MRLVRRQELMVLPAGTLFAQLHKPWAFGGLQLKMDTIVSLGKNVDFWTRQLAWPDANDCGEAMSRLNEMVKDSSISYPVDEAWQRDGEYDDEQVYLVYERADTDALLADLTHEPANAKSAPVVPKQR